MELFEIIKNAPENSQLITDSIVITHAKLKQYDKILCSVSGGSDSDILVDLCQKFDDADKITYLQAKEKMIDIFKIVKGFIDDVRKNTEKNDDGVAQTIANMPTIELTTPNMEEKIPENRKLSIKDVKVKTTPNVLIKYRKPKTDVELLKKVLGVSTNSEVGELTFEYYKDAEC